MTLPPPPPAGPDGKSLAVIGLVLWGIWLFAGLTLCPIVVKLAATHDIKLPLLTRMMIFFLKPGFLLVEAVAVVGAFLYLKRSGDRRQVLIYCVSAAAALLAAVVLVYSRFGSLNAQAYPV